VPHILFVCSLFRVAVTFFFSTFSPLGLPLLILNFSPTSSSCNDVPFSLKGCPSPSFSGIYFAYDVPLRFRGFFFPQPLFPEKTSSPPHPFFPVFPCLPGILPSWTVSYAPLSLLSLLPFSLFFEMDPPPSLPGTFFPCFDLSVILRVAFSEGLCDEPPAGSRLSSFHRFYGLSHAFFQSPCQLFIAVDRSLPFPPCPPPPELFVPPFVFSALLFFFSLVLFLVDLLGGKPAISLFF